MRFGALLGLIAAVVLGQVWGCRAFAPETTSKTAGVEASLITGGLSGLYYPGFLRGLSRSDSNCGGERPNAVCWVEVQRNAGKERQQFGLVVGYRPLSETGSRAEFLLNLETGDITLANQVFPAPANGGSFYMYREQIQAMMDLLGKSNTVLPFEYLADVMSQLDRMQDIDGVSAELYHDVLLRGQHNSVIVTYKAKVDRQVILQFFSGKKALTEKRLTVEQGTARLVESIEIPRQVNVSSPAYLLVSLVPLGQGPSKALDVRRIERRLTD